MALYTCMLASVLALAAASSSSNASQVVVDDAPSPPDAHGHVGAGAPAFWHALPWWGWALLAVAAAVLSVVVSEVRAGRCRGASPEGDLAVERCVRMEEARGGRAEAPLLPGRLPALLTAQPIAARGAGKPQEGAKAAQCE
mmetsp:Transcript_44029/g.88835  ORF Transcript_44029/g.88835 Transcript_44029/m.88835 type:complete len:141 (-) Transcript_44029:320-742(-)